MPLKYSCCVDCGKKKNRPNQYPRCKSCSKKKLWEDPGFQEKQRAYRDDPEFIRKQRESHIEIWASPEKREQQRQTQLETWSDPELRARHSETLSAAYAEKYSDPEEYAAICGRLDTFREENWTNPEYREYHQQLMAQRWEDEEYRSEMSSMIIDLWKNPDYRERRRQTWVERYGSDEREYPIEFDNQLKEAIRDRDGRKCAMCRTLEKDCQRNLDVHHIDYDKFNCDPSNLVSLCQSCHIKTNYSRPFWTQVFTKYRGRKLKQDWQHRVVVTA